MLHFVWHETLGMAFCAPFEIFGFLESVVMFVNTSKVSRLKLGSYGGIELFILLLLLLFLKNSFNKINTLSFLPPVNIMIMSYITNSIASLAYFGVWTSLVIRYHNGHLYTKYRSIFLANIGRDKFTVYHHTSFCTETISYCNGPFHLSLRLGLRPSCNLRSQNLDHHIMKTFRVPYNTMSIN